MVDPGRTPKESRRSVASPGWERHGHRPHPFQQRPETVKDPAAGRISVPSH
ncbi:hypothetical protein KCH_68760 [Kitasatospora cheerisanensis KCTC 2395]|uniref:Uncharacterized protein n=1 Tax=Kitasatospora cheerisanensis KCTC 2395 TaxID=1348663 RepID=A0A066YMW1_9ACTN|nr:hypothetical protein KCH_68760 [Kitasatospora cheerisanensis KCTC 2395]